MRLAAVVSYHTYPVGYETMALKQSILQLLDTTKQSDLSTHFHDTIKVPITTRS
jgi:hypothetical protein